MVRESQSKNEVALTGSLNEVFDLFQLEPEYSKLTGVDLDASIETLSQSPKMGFLQHENHKDLFELTRPILLKGPYRGQYEVVRKCQNNSAQKGIVVAS